MKDERGTLPIIRLDDEGALLQCQIPFLASVEWAGPGSYKTVEVKRNDFVMFLGIRHCRSKANELRQRKARKTRKLKPEERREKLVRELFRAAYYTSLNFLWKEKIVKVTWHGRWGLDQLTEASNFMYLHFLVPDYLRKENK